MEDKEEEELKSFPRKTADEQIQHQHQQIQHQQHYHNERFRIG